MDDGSVVELVVSISGVSLMRLLLRTWRVQGLYVR